MTSLENSPTRVFGFMAAGNVFVLNICATVTAEYLNHKYYKSGLILGLRPANEGKTLESALLMIVIYLLLRAIWEAFLYQSHSKPTSQNDLMYSTSHRTKQNNTMQYNAMQCKTIQCNTIQHNSI